MGNVCAKVCGEEGLFKRDKNLIITSMDVEKTLKDQMDAKKEFAGSKIRHFHQPKKRFSVDFVDLPTRSFENIKNLYKMDSTIGGEGSFGSVCKGTLKIDASREFAIKTILKKKDATSDESKMVMREIELMKILDHPNIVQFYEVYEDKQRYFLVLELLEGGDLFDRLTESESFSEEETKGYIWQMLISVNYLHNKKIAHMDIKPENFMFPEKQSRTLKMIDFGLAQSFKKSERLTLVAGTPYYMAPEVINQDYSLKCDIWSIGVCLYVLITGILPFDGDTEEEIFSSIQTGDFSLKLFKEKGVSKECIEMLLGMLELNDKSRFSALDAIKHPWFQNQVTHIKQRGRDALTKKMVDNLRGFSVSSLIQREMAHLMVHIFKDADEINAIRDIFMSIDDDFSGTIQKPEILLLCKLVGVDIEEDEVETIIDSIYFMEKQVITFLEFEAGLLDKEFFQDKRRLKTLFNFLDTDRSGFIDPDDIYKCYLRFGSKLHKKKIERMVAESDFNSDGKIDFDEFEKIMRNESAFIYTPSDDPNSARGQNPTS